MVVKLSRFAVVQERNTYWSDQSSDIIQELGNNVTQLAMHSGIHVHVIKIIILMNGIIS